MDFFSPTNCSSFLECVDAPPGAWLGRVILGITRAPRTSSQGWGGFAPPHPPGGLGQVGWGITHMGSKWCCKPFSHTYMAGRPIVGSISTQSLCKISPFGNRVVEYVKFARLIVAKRSPSNQTFGEKRNVT